MIYLNLLPIQVTLTNLHYERNHCVNEMRTSKDLSVNDEETIMQYNHLSRNAILPFTFVRSYSITSVNILPPGLSRLLTNSV